MKKLICLLLAFALMLPVSVDALALDGGYYEYTAEELQGMIETCKQNKATAHEMAECARKLGYPENCETIQTAKARWALEDGSQKQYQKMLARVQAREKFNQKKAAYPYAGQVWEILEAKGYNNYVIAGILGNMMAETGGQTLALNPFTYGGGGGYYGLCQWSLYYNPSVAGLDIPSQIEYMEGNIRTNMDYFGGAGRYDRFCCLQDEKEAARYFNSYYERGSGTSVRQDNATAALKYFAGE